MGSTDHTEASLLATIRAFVASLNPALLWQALQEADEGVCLMAPARVRSRRRVR